jgi:Leucine-rich repeat (LRR) protein
VWLGACTALQALYCRSNHLSELPVELGLLEHLTALSCANNPFDEGAPTTLAELRAYATSGRHTKRATG